MKRSLYAIFSSLLLTSLVTCAHSPASTVHGHDIWRKAHRL